MKTTPLDFLKKRGGINYTPYLLTFSQNYNLTGLSGISNTFVEISLMFEDNMN
jgi:hypothetical protein